jgi:hypothetical protein
MNNAIDRETKIMLLNALKRGYFTTGDMTFLYRLTRTDDFSSLTDEELMMLHEILTKIYKNSHEP